MAFLWVFFSGLVSGSVAGLWDLTHGDESISHHQHGPCPDPAEHDHLCGAACGCASCRAPTALFDVSVEVKRPFAESRVVSPSSHRELLDPQEFQRLIYHPPRA